MERMDVLTSLSNVEDLTEHEGELNATPSKRALVFVFSAAILKNELQGKNPQVSEPLWLHQ